MLGLKNFENLAVTISEIELVQKIREGQFLLGNLGGKSTLLPQIATPCSSPDFQHDTSD